MIEDPMFFGIQLTIIGLLVVFVALILISLLVGTVLGNVDKWIDSYRQRGAKPVPEVAEPEPVVEEVPVGTLTPEVVAAISAAVTVVLGRGAVITRVRYRRAPGTNWSVTGRSTIMARRQLKPY